MTKNVFFLTAIVVVAASCAEREYQPIIDSPKTAAFHSDLAACRALAATKQQGSEDVAEGMVFGGVTGVISDGVEGMIAGAIIGGMIGSYEDKNSLIRMRNRIVHRCLTGRGYKIIG